MCARARVRVLCQKKEQEKEESTPALTCKQTKFLFLEIPVVAVTFDILMGGGLRLISLATPPERDPPVADPAFCLWRLAESSSWRL